MVRSLPVFLLTLLLAALATSPNLLGQTKLTEHTLQLDDDAEPGNGKLQDTKFLIGSWAGEALGGQVEESWMGPSGDAMLGMFRLTREDKPEFYELLTLNQVGDTLEMRVKHFSPELDGWEPKEEYHTFKLVKVEEGNVYFSGLTFVPGNDELTIYLAMRRSGELQEETFKLKRRVLKSE